MDFGDFAKLVLRRWYVAAPMLLVTLAMAVYVLMAVKPDYVLTSYVQLVPPTTDTQTGTVVNNGKPRNPWNVLGLQSLSQAATYATEDQTFLNKLKQEGYSTQLDIEQSYPNPVITITVTGDSRAQAEKSTDLITERYAQVTRSLQSQYNVADVDMITTRRLDQGENIKPASGKMKRGLIVVAAGGLLLTFGATIGVDAILRRRQRKQSGPAAPTRTGGQSATKAPSSSTAAVRRNGFIPGSDGARTEVLPAVLDAGQRGRTRTAAERKKQAAGAEYRSRSANWESAPEEAGQASTRPRDDTRPPVGSDATIVLALPKRSPEDNGGKRR